MIDPQAKPLVYLCAPYSSPDAAVREQRFVAVTKVAAELMKQGYVVFSPITHGHSISVHRAEYGWETWREIDIAVLTNCCHKLMILMLDGWNRSEGIAAEVKLARELKLPVTYLDPVKWLSTAEEKEILCNTK